MAASSERSLEYDGLCRIYAAVSRFCHSDFRLTTFHKEVPMPTKRVLKLRERALHSEVPEPDYRGRNVAGRRKRGKIANRTRAEGSAWTEFGEV